MHHTKHQLRSIVIVDDHILVAKALTGIIEKLGGYNVLYEVENGKELIAKFNAQVNIPQIVVLDAEMPVMDGFETAQWLKTHHPDVCILVLSMQNKEESVIRMLRCGVRAYLLKNIYPDVLKTALDTIVEKGYYLQDWVTRTMAMNMSEERQTASSLPALTAQEAEFLSYAITELTYKEIADKMIKSPRTVDDYCSRLFVKFEVKSRVGLVVQALKRGILKLD